MDPISDGCRLCLDPFAEHSTTIEDPELKNQMEKVFCFAIESKEGLRSGVCQSCSYTISEFYQYAEKVRLNQEILNEDVEVKSEPTTEAYETIKVEMLYDPENLQTMEETNEPNEMMLEVEEEAKEEEDAESDADECDQPFPEKSQAKRKRRAPRPKPNGQNIDAAELTKMYEQEKEQELFSKHFNMVCDICGVQTESFKLLRAHFSKEHKREAYVVCCNKRLALRCALLDHIEYHANPNIFTCEVCGKKYKNRQTLKYHRAVHEGKDYCKVCDVCGRSYKSKEGFQQHMNEIHMGIVEERLQCHICQRWLKGTRNLRSHMNIVHVDNVQPVECDTCGKMYPSMSAMKSHRKQVHVMKPKHECDICGKLFKTTQTLKEHISTHTGQPLYSCEYCDMRTTTKAYLYRHTKKKHLIEWQKKNLNSSRSRASFDPTQ